MSKRIPGTTWTGPRKTSKRKKINTVDPFHPGKIDKKEHTGRSIKDLEEEANFIPRSLREMMEWQTREEESQKAKEIKKKKMEEMKNAPKASMFLGDDPTVHSESSDDEGDDEFDKITNHQTTKNQQQTTNNNNNQKGPKRKHEETSTKQGKKDDNNKGKGKEQSGKGKDGKNAKSGKKGKSGKEEEDEEEGEDEKKVQEFWELSDNVKFGETADRPPTITVRPKKAFKMDTQNDAKKIAIDRAREKAVMAYAASKKRKASNSGNKFFL